ncbi:MAG: LysR family transcriptional regulator [Clostridia bacterium]|nr:LysR family transcriptional regulator [Clostridia bacterium]
MNINQLKYVLEVAGSSSMREASTKLFVSQPALSSSIRELEEELGILIFERTNKGISLTDEGRDFISYAKKAVGQYEILEDRYLSKDGGRDRFAVSSQHYSFAIRAFTNVIKSIRPERYDFCIRETKTKEVLDDVAGLKSEVGIVSFSGSNEAVIRKIFRDYQLDFTPLMIRETFVYVWKNHQIAGRDEVSIDEMKGYPCVSFDQSGDGNFYLTEEAMSNYSFDKMIKTDDRATSMEILAELGGYSIGCGMLSGKDAILQGLCSVKLKEEDPITIGYITRKGSILSVYAGKYIEELLKYKEI